MREILEWVFGIANRLFKVCHSNVVVVMGYHYHDFIIESTCYERYIEKVRHNGDSVSLVVEAPSMHFVIVSRTRLTTIIRNQMRWRALQEIIAHEDLAMALRSRHEAELVLEQMRRLTRNRNMHGSMVAIEKIVLHEIWSIPLSSRRGVLPRTPRQFIT